MLFNLIKINKSEPKIIKLTEPIKMMGVSIDTNMKTIYKDSVILGKKFKKIKDSIPDKKIPWAFVAVSKNFSNDNSRWEYLMGDVVISFDNKPEELVSFEIPVKTYAIFTISPGFNFLWGPAIGMTKAYIFNEWLLNSKYEADTDSVGDFEYHDDRSIAKSPSIDLYVPVRVKKIK